MPAAGQFINGLSELVFLRLIILVKLFCGLGDDFYAFGVSLGQLGDVDIDYVTVLQRQKPCQDGGAAFSGLFEVGVFVEGKAERYGRYFEEGGLHCGGDCSGIVGVYSRVCAVVNAGNEKVDGTFVELHNGELDAICGGALDAESREQAIDINPVTYEGLGEGDTVAGAGAAVGRSDDGYVAEVEQLLVDGGQAGGKDAIVICQ